MCARRSLRSCAADLGATSLWLVDLGAGRNRLGASALAQVYGEIGETPADLDDPRRLKAFAEAVVELRNSGIVLAHHDRSDGGLFATLTEMAFAGHCGLDIALPGSIAGGPDKVSRPAGWTIAQLFAEELGAVLQIRAEDEIRFGAVLTKHGLGAVTHRLGTPVASKDGRDATGLRIRIAGCRRGVR